MLKERVLVPLIGAALVISISAIAWSTMKHRRPGPLVLTALGALFICSGRLVWSVPFLVYGGSAALLGGSLWNLWLKRRRPQRGVAVPVPVP